MNYRSLFGRFFLKHPVFAKAFMALSTVVVCIMYFYMGVKFASIM